MMHRGCICHTSLENVAFVNAALFSPIHLFSMKVMHKKIGLHIQSLQPAPNCCRLEFKWWRKTAGLAVSNR